VLGLTLVPYVLELSVLVRTEAAAWIDHVAIICPRRDTGEVDDLLSTASWRSHPE
jgi:hypothetical protein